MSQSRQVTQVTKKLRKVAFYNVRIVTKSIVHVTDYGNIKKYVFLYKSRIKLWSQKIKRSHQN